MHPSCLGSSLPLGDAVTPASVLSMDPEGRAGWSGGKDCLQKTGGHSTGLFTPSLKKSVIDFDHQERPGHRSRQVSQVMLVGL